MSMGSASVATKSFLFYILMDASTIQQNNLRVPKKFVKKCGNKLSSVATLVLPSGDDWLVRLKEVDGKLWFTAGWHEFMVHFSICAGYFLVFKYEGDSIFKVNIFNLTAYEVDYRDKPVGKGKQFSVSNGKEIGNDPCPTFAIKSDVLEGGLDPKMLCGNCKSNLFLTKDADNSQARPRSTQDIGIQFNGNEIDGIMQLLNQAGARQTKRKQRNEPSNPAKETEMPSRKVSKMNEDVSGAEIPERERTLLSAQEFKPSNPHCCIVKRPTFISLDSQLTRDIGVDYKTSTEELKLRSSIEQKVKKTVRKKWKSDGQEPSTEHKEGAKIRYRYYESASARKRSVPAEERERAINAAKAFEPDNPFCWVVLRPSYLYRGCIMNLPSCFAEKHLIGVSGFIKLQTSDGRQWPVWCLYKGGKAKLRQGWFDFALENCIREGDVCVFELLRMEEVVLQVTVFRVTEDC